MPGPASALLSSLLAIALAEPTPPPTDSLAVAPVRVIGTLPNSITSARLDEAIGQGLQRGQKATQTLEGECEDRGCWIERAVEQEQRFVLLAEIEQEGPDLRVRRASGRGHEHRLTSPNPGD